MRVAEREVAGRPLARAEARRRGLSRTQIAWLLVAPALLLRLATALYPVLDTFRLSLTNTHLVEGTSAFIGLGNYARMLRDPKVIETLQFTAIFTSASLLLQLVFGFLIALLLNANLPWRGLLRTVNLLPWAAPTIVVAIAGAWIWNDQFGLVNDLWVRVFGTRPLWLGNAATARLVVIVMDVWKNVPFMAIVLLAALQNVPQEVLDAARVDGCGPLGTLWRIVLPLIAPVVVTMSIFVTIFRLFSFDIVYGLTQGGPGTTTSLLAYRVYTEAIRFLAFGYGAAIAIVLFLIVLVVGLLGFLLLKRVEVQF